MAQKNVSNPEQLDAAITKVASQYGPAILKWALAAGKTYVIAELACFRRLSVKDVMAQYKAKPWMLKAFPAGTPVYEFDESDRDFDTFAQELEHAVIYLKPMTERNKNIAAIPFKQAVTEGERSFEKQKIEEKMTETAEDKRLVFQYPNGFAWYDLLTPKALRNESVYMNHCVGSVSLGYGAKVAAKTIRIISLRDSDNKPHVTIEYEVGTKRVAQIKGNSNSKIKQEYKKAVIGLLKGMLKDRDILSFNTTDLALYAGIDEHELGIRLGENGKVFPLS